MYVYVADNGPKLRVLIVAKWEWPDTAKNRDQPRKMTHSSETEIFWEGVGMGKFLARGVLGICPVDKNRDSKTKN